MTRKLIALTAAAVALATPGLAQRLPPADGLQLSQIIAGIEQTQPVQVFTEVEWDDDGYWDIEFIDDGNRRGSVRVDPMTGQPLSRRR